MAQIITPSSSFRSEDATGLNPQDDDLAAADNGDVIVKNKMVIRKYEPCVAVQRLLRFGMPQKSLIEAPLY